MDEKKKFYKWLIFFASATLLALAALYLFLKLPEFAGRRQRELAQSRELTVTIPEGFTVRQIGEVLEGAQLFSKEEFIQAAQKEEGYLFPDTYRFYKDSKPEEILLRMKENFNKKITPEIAAEINNQRKTLKDVIITASILEEEVQSTEDRKLVAGILWKRLELGIGLNVDSSLTYILGKSSRELRDEDLKVDSPYNTYRYRGLPPTPISNPGLDAILAAIYPTKSPYLYYLSGADERTHYAKTLEEHALNKSKYLR